MKDAIIIGSIMFLLFVAPVLLGIWSHQFWTDTNGKTATRGIFLKDTINLENYKILGTSDTLLCFNGAYIYTRSPMHESFTVCKNAK